MIERANPVGGISERMVFFGNGDVATARTLTAPAADPAQTSSSVGENRTASTAVVWPLRLCANKKETNGRKTVKNVQESTGL